MYSKTYMHRKDIRLAKSRLLDRRTEAQQQPMELMGLFRTSFLIEARSELPPASLLVLTSVLAASSCLPQLRISLSAFFPHFFPPNLAASTSPHHHPPRISVSAFFPPYFLSFLQAVPRFLLHPPPKILTSFLKRTPQLIFQSCGCK